MAQKLRDPYNTSRNHTEQRKKHFFLWFSMGFVAWIVSKIKRGSIFPEMEWGMDFNGNQMRIAIIIIEIITSLD